MNATIPENAWLKLSPLLFTPAGEYQPFVMGVQTGFARPFEVELEPLHADSIAFLHMFAEELKLHQGQLPDGTLTLEDKKGFIHAKL